MVSMTEVRFSQTSLLIQTSTDNSKNSNIQNSTDIKSFAKSDFLDISTQIEMISKKSNSKIDYSALEKKLGIDSQKWGVEAVSDDIFNFAKTVYEKYKLNHSEEDSKKVLDNFYSLAKKSITQGYEEAKNFLGAMPQDVANLAEGTFNRTIEKLDSWYNSELNPTESDNSATNTSTETKTFDTTQNSEINENSKNEKLAAIQEKINISLQESENLKNQILDILKQQGIYLKESQTKQSSFDLKA